MLTIPNKNFLFEEEIDGVDPEAGANQIGGAINVLNRGGQWAWNKLLAGRDYLAHKFQPDTEMMNDIANSDEFANGQEGAQKIGQIQNGLVSAGRAVAPILAKADQGLHNDDSLDVRDNTSYRDWGAAWKKTVDGLKAAKDYVVTHSDPNGQLDNVMTQDEIDAAQAGAQKIGLAQRGIVAAGKQIGETLANNAQREFEEPYASDGSSPKEFVSGIKNALSAVKSDYQKTQELIDQHKKNGIDINDGNHGNMQHSSQTGGVTPSQLGSKIGSKLSAAFAPKPASAPAPNSPWYQDTWNWMTAHPGYTALGAGVPLALAGAYMWNKARKNKNGGQQA